MPGSVAANIHRLVEIRDAADNIPAVQAIKTIEQLDAEAVARPMSNQATPGVTIIIQNEVTAEPRAPFSCNSGTGRCAPTATSARARAARDLPGAEAFRALKW